MALYGYLMMMLAVGAPSLIDREADPEVDQAAVLRLGDFVQHVTNVGQRIEDPFVEAMGPPPSDADKWFISILTTKGCIPCEQLKSDWQTSPWLMALANPRDAKQSWAHYNVYEAGDDSQKFRFEDIKIAGYPTILVQPPRSGRFGDPKIVVFQGTYEGKPEELAREIISAIRQYVERHPAAPVTGRRPASEPPFVPPAPEDPLAPPPAPFLPETWPTIPPLPSEPAPATPDSPTTTPLVAGAAGAVMVLLVTVVVPLLLRTYRNYRTQQGQRPLLSDEQFQTLLEGLSGVTGKPARPNER